MSHSRLHSLLKLALSLCIAIAGATAISAQAQVTCYGTETANFDPPLSNTAQPTTVTISQTLSNCLLSPLTATNNYQLTRDFSCTTFTGGPGASTFTWSDGEQSTFTFNAVVVITNGTFIITQTGTITSGRYNGQSVIAAVTLTPSGGNGVLTDCATSGVASASGVYTLTSAP